jgi:formylglycine-generating enzyme required for sulfatase activity
MPQIKHSYTVEAKSYEPNGYNLYNMAEWTDSSYDPNAYEYVSTMNPNVLDASISEKVARWFVERCSLLFTSTRDYEYADSARSYIGFRTVQDYMGFKPLVQVKEHVLKNKIKNPT